MPTDRTRTFYARWARLYDLLAAAPGVRSWRERTAETLDLHAGDTVVEMGCGTGANVPSLREAVGPGGRVVGVDMTREMLDRARRHPERRGPSVEYLHGDDTRPPVVAADALVATFVVGMFEDPGRVVAEWADLVAPAGRIALLNFQRSDRTLAGPLNLAFESFVRVSSPGGRLSPDSHAETFEARVEAAGEALVERTTDRRFETFAGGYLGLLSGRVGE